MGEGVKRRLMIQQMLNMISTLAMAKFMLNDIPHMLDSNRHRLIPAAEGWYELSPKGYLLMSTLRAHAGLDMGGIMA